MLAIYSWMALLITKNNRDNYAEPMPKYLLIKELNCDFFYGDFFQNYKKMKFIQFVWPHKNII